LHDLLICFALNSSEAMDLHASLENDPMFSCDGINIGKGSRACVQITKWVKSLFAVHDKQKVWNEERDEHWVQTLLWQSTKKLRLAIDAKIREKSLCMIKTDDKLKVEIKKILIDAMESKCLDFDIKCKKFNSEYSMN